MVSHLSFQEMECSHLVPQVVKNPPAMQETWVLSIGWEDPLEKGTAIHSSILAWRIPWTVYRVHGVAKSRTRLSNIHFHFCSCIMCIQFSSVTQSCLTLCNPMNSSMPGLPVHHQLLEFTQTQVHRVSDAIQPSHPLSSPSPPALNLSQHQGLFQ